MRVWLYCHGLNQGFPTPVRDRAARQEVSGGRGSEASSAAPHGSHHRLNRHPQSVENCFPRSGSLVPKKVGDHWVKWSVPWSQPFLRKGSYVKTMVIAERNRSTHSSGEKSVHCIPWSPMMFVPPPSMPLQISYILGKQLSCYSNAALSPLSEPVAAPSTVPARLHPTRTRQS